ncbi:MAG: ATP-binding protein [Anaerolineae bacterium]
MTDLQPCPGADLDDLDLTQVETYRRELDRRNPGSPLVRRSQQDLLLEVGAAVKDGRRLRPTLTGMLFFGHSPQRFYPSFTITFLHFAGTSTARSESDGPLYLDNREFRGGLPAVIDAARAAIYEKQSKGAVVEGFVRHDLPEYPEFAYREALVNAVAHRDYDLEGSFVQVRLFADRLEIQSPGGLGGNLTVDNIAYEQYTRNPHIMRLLEDFGYVERRGLGVDQMIRAMARAGLEPPIFENRGSSFWVTLHGQPPAQPLPDLEGLGLNDRQIRAVGHLQKEGRLTNREYQKLFGVAERTALYDLQGLVESGLALPVSSGRGRYYILRD